ncbi:hypothetical protein [Couchioplanes caeruleus]|nr:hypothetical protein [Couchioplanes caeruleus]ROP31234.1 hypothetical protein EDD30_4125 [Couchioplanes caeruleus]
MNLKRVAIAVAALATALVVTPGAAIAGPHDNANATVSGVSGVDANDAGCATGFFCLYTQGWQNGIKFNLYHCRTYSLNNWNGVGSFKNNNTGGAQAQFLDRNYRVIRTSTPVESVDNFDFSPVWYVRAC